MTAAMLRGEECWRHTWRPRDRRGRACCAGWRRHGRAGRTERRRQDHIDARARRPAAGARAHFARRPAACGDLAATARAASRLSAAGAFFHWPMPVEQIVALGRYPHADPFSAAERCRPAGGRACACRDSDGNAGLAPGARIVRRREGARGAGPRAGDAKRRVLLADEPTMSLDARHQLVVMELLRKAAHAGGAVLAVVHDLALAARFADRVMVMAQGRIVARGATARSADGGAYRRGVRGRSHDGRCRRRTGADRAPAVIVRA